MNLGFNSKKKKLVGPRFRLQIGPKYGRAKWGLRGSTGWVWVEHKKPVY